VGAEEAVGLSGNWAGGRFPPLTFHALQVLGWQQVRLPFADRLAMCSPAVPSGRTPHAVPGSSRRVVVPLRARVFCRPQKTLAHFFGGGCKCLTGS